MGIKSFLIQQGFVTESAKEKPPASKEAPVYFPVQPPAKGSANEPSFVAGSAAPSFVTPLQQNTPAQTQLDPTFVKFFEDELIKANLPGSDYFEFRQQLSKTQQRMTAKGMAAPEVVLQAVLMSFESQEIPPVKLIEAAKHYKEVLKQKNDDFLKGASTEKNNQLQKRQAALQQHEENIKKIQQQLHQLEQQKHQLEESLNKERTQMDVDRSLGQEGIEKIEKAERLIALAHNYIQSNIDTDIKRLETV